MKLLLDTHIWVWFITGSPRLRIHKTLEDANNELWLSPLSTWEVLTLHRKGRIGLDREPMEWVRQALAFTKEAPLTHEIALTAQQLRLHQDPADRFIAATAQVLDLTLVTADQRLLGLGNIKTLANR